MNNRVTEIRRLESKLDEFKTLYFMQQRETELAGQQYAALQNELEKNKQVFHAVAHCLLL